MNYTLPIDIMEMEQRKSEKVIIFSSSSIQTIKNIPNKILGYFIWPFYICFFVPAINFMLWRIQRQTAEEYKRLQANINKTKYEDAKKLYELFTSRLSQIEQANKPMHPIKDVSYFKSIYKKFLKIEFVLRKSKQIVASTLFLTIDPTTITEEDRKTLADLDEFWGNDNDEVYARFTHYHLTHGYLNV